VSSLGNVIEEFTSSGYLKNEVEDLLLGAICLCVGTLSVLDQLNDVLMLLHFFHGFDLGFNDSAHRAIGVDLWQDHFDGDLFTFSVETQLGFACGSFT